MKYILYGIFILLLATTIKYLELSFNPAIYVLLIVSAVVSGVTGIFSNE